MQIVIQVHPMPLVYISYFCLLCGSFGFVELVFMRKWREREEENMEQGEKDKKEREEESIHYLHDASSQEDQRGLQKGLTWVFPH